MIDKPKAKRKAKPKAKAKPKVVVPKTPIEIVKDELDRQGFLHATALSKLTGKSFDTCVRLCSGELPLQGNGLPRIAQALGIDRKDLL